MRELGQGHRASIAGLATIAIVFGGFGAWAGTASVAGAVIAPGRIAAAANRQAVQHPDGGTVTALLVEPGAQVEKGDVLIQLDSTKPAAEVEVLEGRMFQLDAEGARLLAERDGDDMIEPSTNGPEAGDHREVLPVRTQGKLPFGAHRPILKDGISRLLEYGRSP